MRSKVFYLLFLIIFVGSLHARIGEKLETIQSRHGAGKEIGEEQVLFTIENFDVTITFAKGVSFRETYTTRLENNPEQPTMTDKEVQKLLEIQGNGKSWLKMKQESDGRMLWSTADGSTFAHFLPKYNSVTFTLSPLLSH